MSDFEKANAERQKPAAVDGCRLNPDEPSVTDVADQVTAWRIAAFRNGYLPIPITAPSFAHAKVKSPGKQPFFTGWQKVSRATLTETQITNWPQTIQNHPNSGLLTGELVGVDIDVPTADLAAQIDRIAEAMLDTTPLHRIGKAPKRLRCYRAAAELRKSETPELHLPDGTKVQIEILLTGQQFVAFGVHPDTGRPYEWPHESPVEVPLSDLPAGRGEVTCVRGGGGGGVACRWWSDGEGNQDSAGCSTGPAALGADQRAATGCGWNGVLPGGEPPRAGRSGQLGAGPDAARGEAGGNRRMAGIVCRPRPRLAGRLEYPPD